MSRSYETIPPPPLSQNKNKKQNKKTKEEIEPWGKVLIDVNFMWF